MSDIHAHLYEARQRDMDRIGARLSSMGTLAQQALETSLKVLLERNRQLGYAVILRDQNIDELEKEVDRLCLEFLVRQQPVAQLLRFVYAAIKINLELERIGDYAESIARQSLKLIDQAAIIPTERILEIAGLSITMLREALQAFLKEDVELARRTIATEVTVDGLKSKLNKDLVALFRENKLPFEALNPLIMIVRRLERVSDQARNICLEAIYLCTGESVKHLGAEAIRVLFVDEHNACRSQMAEAVGHSLGQPKFVFASAGLNPVPVEPATLAFLKEKGLDLSRAAAKALHQVPNLDHYQVIICLAGEARQWFPEHAHKTLFLDWSVPDPSALPAGTPQARAAYEETYQFLQNHLQALLEAILGENKK